MASRRFTLDIQTWLKPDLTVTVAIMCHLSSLDWQSETQTLKAHLSHGIRGDGIVRVRIRGQQRGYIYDGGWVILKCSANHHLCIFGLGLGGLWVLWAARQRWNRKEKCSWKRMRWLRAPDLWNSSLQMKCTLPSGLFFSSLFRISC